MVKKYINFVLLFTITFFCGCANQNKILNTKKSPVYVPAGVDSSIAVISDSTAKNLFVSFEEEDEAIKRKQSGSHLMAAADTTWNFLKSVNDSLKIISDEQKNIAIERYNLGALKIQRITKIEQRIESEGLDDENLIELKKLVFDLLNDAKHEFETAIRINPFDVEAKDALGWTLWKLIDYFDKKENLEELINVLTELSYIDKGEHQLYFRLGQAYYSLQSWDNALINFKKAEKTLKNYATINFSDSLLSDPESSNFTSEDSIALYTYLFYQADIYVELLNASSAIERLESAKIYANDLKLKNRIEVYIDWIRWDDGNITASKYKDKILNNYATKKEHEKTLKEFEKLLSMLNEEQSKDEINWRIACIEFSQLNNVEQGIARLSKVVLNAEKDSFGSPVDTTYKQYFEDFAIMCNNIAIHNLENRLSRQVAFTYFLQAVQISSSIRGKLYIDLANLSKYNPEKCIEYCYGAFMYINQQDTENLITLLKLLTNGYRKLDNPEKVKQWYEIWKFLKIEQWKVFYYNIAASLIDNPECCIRWSEYSLENFKSEFNKDEKKQLYALIINSYKRLRNQEQINYWSSEYRKFMKGE